MTHPMELSIIRIFSQSGQVVGTGFMMDDRRIMTCAHVVRTALGSIEKTEQFPRGNIKFDFPLLEEKKECYGKVAFWDVDRDIAGLEVTGDPPVGANPVWLVEADDLWEHKFRTFGFPRKLDAGVWASGILQGKTGDAWIQIIDTKETGYRIEKGFSGAPIWDEKLQGVVGMVVAEDTDEKRKAAYCIPYKILGNWKDIRNRANDPKKPSHIFMCYKRHADPDQKILDFLEENLIKEGFSVFTDTTMRMGESWMDRIDQEIKKSDFLVVLLSDESSQSEMVQAEVHRAYEYRKMQGHPHVLPIHIIYEGLLPYSISAFLNPLQYIEWKTYEDNQHVLYELVNALRGKPTIKTPVSLETTFKQQGEKTIRPAPEFDARLLEVLEAPGGAVKLRDRFYIERNADGKLKSQVSRYGTTVTIRAARQTGKSSLLVRGMQHAKQNGRRVVHMDLQRVDQDHLSSIDKFLRYFAEYIVFKLKLEGDQVEKCWQENLSPQEKLSYLLEDYVFEQVDNTIVLGMDEIDRLLQTDFYSEFFALLRSWHNERASNEIWDKLNIIMVISTEPYLLIPDPNQSPFNVGTNLYLEDFDYDQTNQLNQLHGVPVVSDDFVSFNELFGGHPYLTRKALYTLVAENMTFSELKKVAMEDFGPFGDHLRRYHWMISNDADLKNALKKVIQSNICHDNNLHRLLRAGLVKASGNVCKCRCDLYRLYFKDKL